MNEWQALQQIRPKVPPMSPQRRADLRQVLFDDDPSTETMPGSGNDAVDASEGAVGRRPASSRKIPGVAAGLVVAVGMVGVWAATAERGSPQSPTDTNVTTAAPTTSAVAPPTELAQSGLLLPAADVEPTYAQHNPAAPQRTRALLEAPDGRTVAVTVDFNSFGQLPAEWDQQEIAGTIWAGGPQGGGFTYVAVDDCRLLVVNPGGTEPTGWDPAIEPLLASIDLNDPTAITLPDNWNLIGVGSAGDEYVIEIDPDLPGVSPVLLTQSLNSNVGSLVASVPGVGIREVDIDGSTGWQTTEPDPSGRYYTAWNRTDGAVMIGTKEDLSATGVERVLNELTPTATSEWDARYRDIDAGRNISRVTPTCDTGGMTVT